MNNDTLWKKKKAVFQIESRRECEEYYMINVMIWNYLPIELRILFSLNVIIEPNTPEKKIIKIIIIIIRIARIIINEISNKYCSSKNNLLNSFTESFLW